MLLLLLLFFFASQFQEDFIQPKRNLVLFLCPVDFKLRLYCIKIVACIVQDARTQNCVNQIERIQDQAARYYDFRNSISEIKPKLGWKSLQQRRKCLRLKRFFLYIYIYNVYYGNTGLYISKYIIAPNYVSRRINN